MREERGFKAVSILEVSSGKTSNRINDGLAKALLNLLGHVLYLLTLAITWPQRILGQEGSLVVAAQVYGDVRRQPHA
jgi:hypothetical protein